MIKVSIIIIAYNSEDFIRQCIASVLENLPVYSEVMVLDNNSQDKTVDILNEFLPRIQLIKSAENLGFARGNNRAVRKAKGEYLFFLNPDTEINSGVINELVKFYGNTKDAGIVAPKLVMSDGQIQPSVKNLPTVWGALKEFILGIKNAYSEYVPQAENPISVEYVYGAAILIKKELFVKLGGFDEKYFLYYEDADLCKKVLSLGKRVYYYPLVSVKHLVGATKSDENRYELNHDSFIKYHGYFQALILEMIFLIPRLRRRLGLS